LGKWAVESFNHRGFILGMGNTLNHWKIFEQNIVTHSMYMGITAIKIPDGVKMVRDFKGPGLKPIRYKTSFDFACSIDGIAAFFDAKAESSNNRFNYKSLLLNEKKIHQWEALCDAHEKGSIAGLLIWFPLSSLIGWANV